jgi:hypothetical protein
MAVTPIDADEMRAGRLRELVARNRLVGVLRIAVPAVGIAAFLLLVGQIYLANMMRQYGVAGIRIDRGDMVVEAPQYAGTGQDGSRYLVTAREARTSLSRPEEIAMSEVTLELSQSGEASLFASAATATMNTQSQVVRIPGTLEITSDDALTGTLGNLEADMKTDIATATGPVELTFGDGTHIVATGMVRDGRAGSWTFSGATVTIDDLPEAEQP